MTRVFYDANVIFAASDSTKGAARVLVRLAKRDKSITLLATEYTIREARQTIERDKPSAITEFYEVEKNLSICLEPTREFVKTLNLYMPAGVKLPKKDLPVMGGAIVAGADWLVTHDEDHFGPLYGRKVCGVEVLRPRVALRRLKQSPGS